MKRPTFANLRSPAALARLVITFAIGLGLDLWTKALTIEHLSDPVREIAFMPGWLHFTYVRNFGAVFGAGQGMRWLFVLVASSAIIAVLWMYSECGKRPFYQILLAMLLGGIVGNLYDRMVYGFVRDMIHALPQWPNLFPWVFNIADSLLCVGIFFMIVYSFIVGDDKQEDAAKPSESSDKP